MIEWHGLVVHVFLYALEAKYILPKDHSLLILHMLIYLSSYLLVI